MNNERRSNDRRRGLDKETRLSALGLASATAADINIALPYLYRHSHESSQIMAALSTDDQKTKHIEHSQGNIPKSITGIVCIIHLHSVSIIMSTYLEIRRLSSQLSSTKVTERRSAGERLQSMLSLLEVRQKLKREAKGGHRGLAEMWRYIILNAIVSVQSLANSKKKIQPSDINLPFKLIKSCDTPDEKGAPFEPSKLSRKEAKLVFTYCYEMLQDECILEMEEVGLLDFMAYICKGRTYVAYMRPHQEMIAIVKEVEKRLLPEDESAELSSEIKDMAASIWENLLVTCTRELGIGLHLLMPWCIRFVALWCQRNRSNTGSYKLIKHLYRGLAALIESDLEQAVVPLSRHGRSILSFAKRQYAFIQAQPALDEYFLAHLRVSQVAGRLQGLIPGDLGDLGKASLSMRQITFILEVLLAGIMKPDYGHDDVLLRNAGENPVQLELAARLLACAQRMYLASAEWNQWEDPVNVLISLIEEEAPPDQNLSLHQDRYQERVCPADVLAKSPFVEGVLRFLFPVSAALATESQSYVETGGNLLGELLQASSSTTHGIDKNFISAALRIITICATLFPSGVCWTSSNLENWHILPPLDQDPDHLNINASSVKDLAFVVQVVSGILEWCGGAGGDDQVQISVLRCLSSLVTSSSALVMLWRMKETRSSESLDVAWRRVWVILFRPELRYRSFTKSPKPGSKGELILKLLFDIVRTYSLDSRVDIKNAPPSRLHSAFVYQNQKDLWDLPIFSQKASNASAIVFRMMYAVLSTVGISEHGNDAIFIEPGDVIGCDLPWNRRTRLIYYCMRALENKKVTLEIQTAASACLGALVQGPAPFLREITVTRSALHFREEQNDNVLANIWSAPAFNVDSSISSLPFMDPRNDWSEHVRSRLTKMLTVPNNGDRSSYFIPRSQVEHYFKIVSSRYLKSHPRRETVDAEMTETENRAEQKFEAIPDLIVGLNAIKVLLTISLSGEKPLPESAIALLSENLSQCLRTVVSKITSISESQGTFLSVFRPLLGLTRGMTFLASRGLANWPDSVMEAVALLFDTSDALLKNSELPTEAESVNRHDRHVIPDDVLMDDSDTETQHQATKIPKAPLHSDEEGSYRRKRKRRHDSESTPRKRLALNIGPPDEECKFLLASLLLALRPSYTVCELVATTLLEVDKVDDEIQDEYINVFGGVVASSLLTTEEVLLYSNTVDKISSADSDNGHPSIVLLVCSILAAVRSVSPPDSVFHFFGLDICSDIVQKVDGGILDSELTQDEARYISELLFSTQDSSERRSLSLRPAFRAYQLHHAVSAFSAGKSNFHLSFDKPFPRSLVLPSLVDLNGFVRHIAGRAVAAALRILPEEKVLESVRKRLPSFFFDENDEISSFKLWYSDKDLGCGDSFKASEVQVWEDAMSSIRYGVLNFWSEVIRSSSSKDVSSAYIFDLVRLAATRPEFDGLSFVVLEKTAHSMGHLALESLFEAFSDNILQRWIRSDSRLLELPLIITSPSLVQRLLQGHHLSAFFNNNSTEEVHDSNWQKIVETAASEFVSRHSFTVLPQILYRSVAALMESGVTKDYRRRFVEENYLKELCSVYDDKYDDEVVRTVLKAHLVDTFSYLAMRCNSEREQKISLEIECLVKGLLGEVTFFRAGGSGLQQAARRLLELNNSELREGASLFLSSAQHLVGVFISDPLKREDGLSTLFAAKTELLVFARYLSVNRVGKGRPKAAWDPFDTILAVFHEDIRRGNIDVPQLRFCLQLLSTFLIDRKLRIFHPVAASSLSCLVKETLKGSEHSCFSEVFVEILHIVFDVLAQNLQAFLYHCEMSKKNLDISLRRIIGLLGGYQMEENGASDFWGWGTENLLVGTSFELSTHAKDVPAEVCITLEACREILELIIKDRDQAKLTNADILGAYRASELSSPRDGNQYSLHPAFGISTWIESVVGDPQDEQTPRLRVLSFETDELPQFVLSVKSEASDANMASFSIEAKQIVDELRQMEIYLSFLKRQGSLVCESKLRPSHLSRLARLCGPSFPDDIRLAASRCLGEVDLSLIDMDAAGKEESNVKMDLRTAIESGILLRTLQAQSIEALAVSLKSADPKLGLLAVETLKALLSTRVGNECQSHFTNEPAQSLLKQLASRNQKTLKSNLHLANSEVELLKPKSTQSSPEVWCWDESLWTMPPNRLVSFDRWICFLVPSLLVCCYGSENSSGSLLESSKTFYGLCQRMSALQPEFAARLFPSIIVDLFFNSENDGNGAVSSDPVNVDTWIGDPRGTIYKNLSRCFTALLKSCTYNGEQKGLLDTKKVLNLAVGTLDILRQLTQHRFLASRNHRRNVIKKEATAKKKADRPDKPWVGLRYGIVLNVDGLLFARACLAAGQMELSLFYAEIFADCCFGSSSQVMEAITRSSLGSRTLSSGDISGFVDYSSEEATVAGKHKQSLFLNLIRDCYSQLDEPDAKEATEGFIRDLSVISPGNEAPLSSVIVEQTSHIGQLDMNAQMNQLQRRQNIRAIADVLDGMGLRFTLDAYIAGVMLHYQDILDDGSLDELGEKSLKCNLYNMTWDGLTQLNDETIMMQSGRGVSRTRPLRLGSGNFHSELLEGMVALKNDDYPTCLGHVSEARKLLIKDPFLQSIHGFLGESMQKLIDRSRALNFLEKVITKNTSLSGILEFLTLEKESVIHPDDVFVGLDLSLCVKEITLRHLHQKARQSGGAEFSVSQDLLIDHMRTSYSLNTTMNQTEEARGVLARIRSLIRSEVVADNTDFAQSSLLQLQLEEAQLLEKTGGFTAAIRSAKQSIRKLQARQEPLGTTDAILLADALLVCGKWMNKYKVEPAHTILDSYLRPGGVLSLKVLEGCSSSKNTHRASSALLAVSELASSIFDTVSTRVQSTEWLEDGRSLEQRQVELKDCTEMIQKVQTKSGNAKKGKEKEWSDLCMHRIKLSREITRSEQRRHKIMESVSTHRELVLKSIVKALGLVGIVSSKRPMSKYVYRMIDIWLSVVRDANHSDCIESIISEAIETVPSFQFVPVAGQLFSRLEASSSRHRGTFQQNLRNLISKMCLDHPYHCLIQLITLSNGTEGNDVDVESESAVQAASELIMELKRGEIKWIGLLIESYQILANAYVQLAMAPTEQLHRGETNKFPYTAIIKKASDRLDCCLGRRSLEVAYPPCILTKPPQIRPGCDYGDGMKDPIGSERVSGFDSSFTVTDTGIHRPKIVVCIGSRGGRFRQLVKGEDDVRQDAVMQQVFGYVNQLTGAHRPPSSRGIDPHLRLVTYNIIPLGPKSGVSEMLRFFFMLWIITSNQVH